ncbi:MAG TPA: metalloregulator ArsR/SmtB family transcription factor [Longimicrobiales bacterium]|nr:metalloregulator ArsR/SmtB family transcription factor [Longimicrobiales bacterium]
MAGAQEAQPSRPLVRVLAALSDENRFRIVELLSVEAADLSCGKIGQALGLSPSLISHHLSVLETAGVIERRKNGLWTLNRLRREELRAHLAVLEGLLRPVA